MNDTSNTTPNENSAGRRLGCGFMTRAHTDDYMFRTVGGAFGYAAPATVYGEEDAS